MNDHEATHVVIGRAADLTERFFTGTEKGAIAYLSLSAEQAMKRGRIIRVHTEDQGVTISAQGGASYSLTVHTIEEVKE